MAAKDLPRLAALLHRPVDSFPALAELDAAHIARLYDTIEASCHRHERRIAKATPWMLRPLIGPGMEES